MCCEQCLGHCSCCVACWFLEIGSFALYSLSGKKYVNFFIMVFEFFSNLLYC